MRNIRLVFLLKIRENHDITYEGSIDTSKLLRVYTTKYEV